MKSVHRWLLVVIGAALLIAFESRAAYAMHIMEGFLPPFWAVLWFVLVLPFWILAFARLIG